MDGRQEDHIPAQLQDDAKAVRQCSNSRRFDLHSHRLPDQPALREQADKGSAGVARRSD
jgi:hypothetical protein